MKRRVRREHRSDDASRMDARFASRWSYTADNPRIPGTEVSVLPVAQLLILFPLSFWLTACKLSRVGARS